MTLALVVLAGGAGLYGYTKMGGDKKGHSEVSSQSRKGLQRYTPSAAEWASLTIQPVTERGFRAEQVTEGKIAIDEDRSTPVFSPYAGRVTKVLARPGDQVAKGQPLFVIEAADNVQAQNDFIGAMMAMNKAKSALDLAQLQGTRAKDLFEGKAVPLKDYQQSQATLIQAGKRHAFVADGDGGGAQQAAHSRPHRRGHRDLPGKAPHQSRNHHLRADRRHRGPAQDRPRPVCQRQARATRCSWSATSRPSGSPPIVRETDSLQAWPFRAGQSRFNGAGAIRIDRSTRRKINYVAQPAMDPATSRRLMVRATINNPNGFRAQARDVRQCHHLHGRAKRPAAGGAPKTGLDL